MKNKQAFESQFNTKVDPFKYQRNLMKSPETSPMSNGGQGDKTNQIVFVRSEDSGSGEENGQSLREDNGGDH